ncbi:hypothetical protein [Desulfurococcus amylolyticus]|uniref:Glycosyltransferase RgtA/B/C/D-like domain-containing protein n=1 Tax=Desulfurococcus amylolyticus DSM 16532 TaxID=768672 RepID=I3XRG1_DESAM|nr:hypothetical protein [Desulfurococcus amylolyticus]AFL66535.1 hypothetical protein Desfe_0634 [Desulfurococcus amylolyticus DSM 16532]
MDSPSSLYIGGLVKTGKALLCSYPLMLSAPILSIGLYMAGKYYGLKMLLEVKPWRPVKPFHIFLAGFILGFAVRILPEIHYWPYPVGYDIVEYIAHARDFLAKPMLFGTYVWNTALRNTPPLLDWILYPFSLFVDPWYLFKVYPAIVAGSLVGLKGLLMKRVFKYSGKWVFTGMILTSLSLLVLRLTWDLHKQGLATIILLTALLVVDDASFTRGSLRRHFAAASLLILMGLASEFGVLFSLVLILLIVYRLLRSINPPGKSLIAVALYAVTAVIQVFLYSWYMRTPLVANTVTIVAPPIVTSDSGWAGEALSYLIAGAGVYIVLYTVAYNDSLKKAWLTTMLTLILILYAATTWLMPLTGLAGGEYDRVLMSITPLMIACGVSVFSHAGKIPGVLLALLVITPGLYATLNPSLQYLNQPYVYALNRMPPYLGPVPGNEALLNDLLDVSMYAAKTYWDEGVLVTSDPYMRFIHLRLRNPDTSRPINTLWSLSPDALASLIASQGVEEFVVLMEKQPAPEGFKDAVSTLLRDKYGVTEVMLRVETVYCGTSYCLYKFIMTS